MLTGDLQRVSSEMLKLQPQSAQGFRLWTRWRKVPSESLLLAGVLALLLNARPQLHLIRIIRSRCAAREKKPADDHDGEQYELHVRDHPIRQPDFNQKSSRSVIPDQLS